LINGTAEALQSDAAPDRDDPVSRDMDAPAKSDVPNVDRRTAAAPPIKTPAQPTGTLSAPKDLKELE
jgi:hypothetical protein